MSKTEIQINFYYLETDMWSDDAKITKVTIYLCRGLFVSSLHLYYSVFQFWLSIMPLHKYPPKLWDALKLQKGIYARLPKHYLKSLEQKEPTPVHWKPLGVKYRANPKTGLKERVQDIPVPIYYPPESQDGLWGGEGWISGYRYANNDKVHLQKEDLLCSVRLSEASCFRGVMF